MVGVQYVYGPWQSFVRDCELFSAAPSCVQSGTTKCAKPVATDPWWLHLLGALWRTNTYNYGTGVVPNHGEGWQSYAAEGEVRPHLHHPHASCSMLKQCKQKSAGQLMRGVAASCCDHASRIVLDTQASLLASRGAGAWLAHCKWLSVTPGMLQTGAGPSLLAAQHAIDNLGVC